MATVREGRPHDGRASDSPADVPGNVSREGLRLGRAILRMGAQQERFCVLARRRRSERGGVLLYAAQANDKATQLERERSLLHACQGGHSAQIDVKRFVER